MNIFDIFVIIIFIFCIALGFRKGLIKAIFDLTSFIISIILANMLYPYVSSFLKSNTNIYSNLRLSVVNYIGFSEKISDLTLKSQTEIINNLNLPDFLTNGLLVGNNPVIHNILNVDTIEDYIAGYIANLCINALALVITFLVVFICMKILFVSLNIVSKFPIINQFNKLGGIIIGVVQGFIVIGILNVFLFYFFSKPENTHIYEIFQQSIIAYYLLENNFIINFIINTFK